MREFRSPVIALGGDLTALGLATILGKRGIDVYLVVDRRDQATFSKYCKGTVMAPGIRRNKDVLRRVLTKMARSLSRRAVVYPTSDLDSLNLAELKNDLPDDCHCVVGDKEAVKILVNKSEFYKTLARYGIDYPFTHFPEDLEEVRRVGAKITYPILIKPSITQLFTERLHVRAKGFVARSPRELTDYYRLATRNGIEVIFQEIIPGPPSHSYQLEGYYDATFRPTVLFARQRLRIWPPDFGNTTLCVSIPLERLANEKQMVSDFIRAIGYQGLMSAEFKRDSRDGMLKLLEINCRAWWHIWLSACCGADIAFSSYLDAIGEKTEYVENYETGVKSIYLLLDLLASGNMLLNRNLGFLEWLTSLRGITRFSFFPRDDLSPFIMDCANLFFRFLSTISRKRVRALLSASPTELGVRDSSVKDALSSQPHG
jgi:predicted ATP-grasp superfamily ATP-dependent carboligase